MEPDRFVRIKQLLLAVADLSESERGAYLEEACKEDSELRREVESILAHERDSSGALATGGAVLGELHHEPPLLAGEHTMDPTHGSPAGDPGAAGADRVTRVGKYAIEDELGRGGMGVVYRARDDRLKRQVALKTLPASFANDPFRVQRFEREAQLLAALNHPNIATIYTLEEAEQIHFLTMELVPGDTLADRIAPGPLGLGDALSVCRQIATAVEAAHKNGIIHRDLKPANVKITPEGQVKVLDFGIAKAMGDSERDPAPELTGTGATLGTPGYMSPEQIRGETADHRTDIFALGCILYECLTGERVFRGGSGMEVAAATLDRDPDWDLLPAETPQALRELLGRCLAKDVDERVAEVAEARRGLEELVVARRAAPPALTIEGRHRGAVPRNNLPVQITSFVGREQELAEIEKLLTGTHLLTLTGVGGSGKTRLGLEVATRSFDSFPHGVWLVELAPLADPGVLPQTVMSALGLPEQARRTPVESLTIFFKEKTSLLILDNCEHLLTASAKLADTLLRTCPELKILASSREGLGITGETTYHVPSLELPDAEGVLQLARLREVDAVRLFLERAAAALPGFALTEENAAATVEICRRLDGIPLAIELAAARLRAMSVEDVSERLDDRFRLLTGGSRTALPRHQTLRALIDWSYEHLTSEEQALFRRLSVFAGGWSLDAAEAVCAGETLAEWEVVDLLTHLVDKSLVEIGTETGRHSTRTRYRMLETVRQYARERLLHAGEGDEARRRHRDFYLGLAEEAEPHTKGAEQLVWFDRLDAEHDNLRLALDTCTSAESAPELGARLVDALVTYWHVRGFWTEGRTHCTELLNRPDGGEAARVGLLSAAGGFAANLGDRGEARKLAGECLSLSKRMGADARVAKALSVLALCAYYEGDSGGARELTEEALALCRDLGDKHGTLANLISLQHLILPMRSDPERAIRRFDELLTMAREVGDRVIVSRVLDQLGNRHAALCNFDDARSAFEEGLRLARELDVPEREAWLLNNLACLDHSQGRLKDCRALSEEAMAISRELGSPELLWRSWHHLALVAENQGDDSAAEAFYAQALAISREKGSLHRIVWALGDLAVQAARRHDVDRARACIDEALSILEELADRSGLEYETSLLGYALVRLGDYAHARQLLADGSVLHQGSSTEMVIEALDVYAALAIGVGNPERAVRVFGAAEALREQFGAVQLPIYHKDCETDQAALRSELGEEVFAQAYAEGQAMGMEQAIDYAIGEGDSARPC